jgi:hypothetical protein
MSLVCALISCVTLLSSCASSVGRRDPTGELFPSVRGTALAGREVTIPDAFKGSPLLLLVGYVMETQFDLDRWLLGLAQAGVEVPVYEVPTIEGLLPGVFAGAIDSGMRSGIPAEDWAVVVTVYADAGDIVDFTGNERPRNGRVLLLWFHDRGYSARLALELGAKAAGGK